MTKAKQKKKNPKPNRNRTETNVKIKPTHIRTHARTHIHLTTRRNFLDVSVFCSVNSQWTAVAKWLIKENEGHDICMAATGFLFLALKIQKRGDVWVRPTLSKRKILVCTSLPYSTCELLNPCPKHTVQGPHCAETSLRVVQLATKQNRTVDDTL